MRYVTLCATNTGSNSSVVVHEGNIVIMSRYEDEDPDNVAERQRRYRANRVLRESKLLNTREKSREAFKDILATLGKVMSSYEELAAIRNDKYTWRIEDYQRSIERARQAYAELFEKT